MEEAKLIISHGGTIKFHRGKNQHVYHGGRNRMLHVPRNISFKEITVVLSAMCGGGFSVGYFKYQIDGFDLDTLVSVTNERDLRNMMREFDYAEPDSVMRIFLFLEHRRHPRVNHVLEYYWRRMQERVVMTAFPSPRAARTCCFLLVTTVKGAGWCPTQIINHGTQDTNFASHVDVEEYKSEIIKLKAKAAEEKKRQLIEHIVRYLLQQQKDNLFPNITVEMNSLNNRPSSTDTQDLHGSP
ncbi:hypothetical protein PIB30_045495 [Stylosanthes scabra]|uniref:PB1 domain-containing protein n=1 Tax=Stylosanthes scabra TaxID=79078 RepID=A0ABU6YGR9_9FABA|nr:hypothetical protein [Stylosanthes scabra]